MQTDQALRLSDLTGNYGASLLTAFAVRCVSIADLVVSISRSGRTASLRRIVGGAARILVLMPSILWSVQAALHLNRLYAGVTTLTLRSRGQLVVAFNAFMISFTLVLVLQVLTFVVSPTNRRGYAKTVYYLPALMATTLAIAFFLTSILAFHVWARGE